jgi:hypothetical protein
MQADAMREYGGGFVIQEPAAAIDDASQQPLTDSSGRDGLRQDHAMPPPHAGQVGIRQEQRLFALESDNLGIDRRPVLALEPAPCTQWGREARRRRSQPHDARHAARQPVGQDPPDLFLKGDGHCVRFCGANLTLVHAG